MTELEDTLNEISSHEWESNLAKIICGSLVNLNELIEDISDEDLHERLSDKNKFRIFECFFEPLLYYKNKYNLPPNMPKSKESDKDEFILENPLYCESENGDLSELFRFGKTPIVSIQELFGFVLSVLHLGGFNVSSFVLSVINMARFVARIKIPLCQHNWRPIFITSLILSDKLWDDSCAKTGDLARTIGFISPNALKYLELIFCRELDWKITFKLDTIKDFISKVVNSKLDSELIEKVISSETYQSYCYEGIHEPSAIKHESSIEEKLENKNMMNNVIQSSTITNIHDTKIPLKINQTINNFQNNYSRMSRSILQQPQLQRGVSFHGNHHPINAQSTSSTLINSSNNVITQVMGNQITNISNKFGVYQQHITTHPSSNMKRPSVPVATLPGRYATLNKTLYSPARNQMSFSNNNNNIAFASNLNSKNHIVSLTSPKSNFTDLTQKNPGLSVLSQNLNSNSSLSGRNSTSENLPIGNHPRSFTPNTHHFQKKIVNPAKNPEATYYSINSNTNQLNFTSPFNERGRDTSCLTNLKQPTPSQIATRMNSNPNILEQKPSNYSRHTGTIKRSSSEHSRLNPTHFQGNQRIKQLSHNLPVSQLRRGVGEGDGFFSMARNKVSSAITSITRTFGLSSAKSNQIDENNNTQETNFASPNSNQITPTVFSNKDEIEPNLNQEDCIQNSHLQNSSQENNLSTTSSIPNFSNTNQRNLSMPPKSNIVHSQLSENNQKSAIQSGVNIASNSTSVTSKVSIPVVKEQHHLRSLSTDRVYNGNYQPHGNVVTKTNNKPEKRPSIPLPEAPTINSSSSSSNRICQSSLYNLSSVADRPGGNMHADLRRQSVGRGVIGQVRNAPSPNLTLTSGSFGGRLPGAGISLNRNMSFSGRNMMHSQVTNHQVIGSVLGKGGGLADHLFGGKTRMQSSSPSNSVKSGLRPTFLQSTSPKAAFQSSPASKLSLFSMDKFISPISNFLKGTSPSTVSSSTLKASGTQIGLSSIRRQENLRDSAGIFGSGIKLVK